MKIIVDAFGGDNAPLEVIKGSRNAKDDLGVDIALVGDKEKIFSCAAQNKISLTGIDIIDAPDVIAMTDQPGEILKSKKNCSMAVGLQALADGKGDAFVSAGSTGALVMGATFIVKRIKGVKRPAIGSVLPSNDKPFLLLDCGANADCTAEHLKQFAQMGAIYSEKFVKVQSPRVALANIGTEDSKGDRLRHEAFDLLKDTKEINFIGNVETRDVPYGCCDVLVADGFTGNIILKLYEGVAGAMMANIKSIFKKSSITMLAAMMVKGGLLALKVRMDYSEFGGAPLLGASRKLPTRSKKMDNRELEKKIGYNFKNKKLLTEALTHSSYANERQDGTRCNERLEFLGDSVLGFISAEHFFHHFKHLPEGELTKRRAYFVCEKSLSEFARTLGIGDYLLFGKGEVLTGGKDRPSILADAFEAVLAAIYLDGGIEPAKKFVFRFIDKADEEKPVVTDYKTTLQEIVQRNPEEAVEYVLVGESGPDHNKTFSVEVHLNSNVIGHGSGRSKKIAEQAAAKEALELMGLKA